MSGALDASPVLAGSVALAPSASPPSRGRNKFAQNYESVVALEPIITAVRVRPDVRAVGRARAEEGYPYADAAKLEALRQEDAQRASVDCLSDPTETIRRCRMPVPLPARISLLMCRHKRLGAGCPASMALVPEEMWLRIFAAACTLQPIPNVVALGPPPGSNATAGVINPATPPPAAVGEGGGAAAEGAADDGGATTTTGIFSSIRAMGPCFNSPAAKPSA